MTTGYFGSVFQTNSYSTGFLGSVTAGSAYDPPDPPVDPPTSVTGVGLYRQFPTAALRSFPIHSMRLFPRP